MSRRYQSYQRYLESPHWRDLRLAKFEECGRHCQNCNTLDKIRVHHVRYRNLIDCVPADLVVLCEDCHNDFHNAAQLQSLKLKDCEELFQIRHLINWLRTLPPEDRRSARGAARRQRKQEKRRIIKCKPRILHNKIKRMLLAGRGTPEAIDKVIAYLIRCKKRIEAGEAGLPADEPLTQLTQDRLQVASEGSL